MKLNGVVFALANLVILAIPMVTRCYETDTHFYATYAMTRYAGINHETAKVIASAAQWPDETEILGSPLVAEIGIGTKMRRLFHFACPPVSTPGSAHNMETLAGPVLKFFGKFAEFLGDKEGFDKYMESLNGYCEVAPIYPAAYNILFEGLQEGNLIKAATAIHTIEDSFAHAGTLSTVGHAPIAHVVDRPFTEFGNYQDMVRAVMAALVAIRKNLPQDSLDKTYKDPQTLYPNKLNYQLTIDELQKSYLANSFTAKSYFTDSYKEPALVAHAIKFLLKKAQNMGKESDFWIDPSFNVMEWLKTQSDLMQLINAGQAGVCIIPKVREHEPDASYINCVLTYVVARLMPVHNEQGLAILDKYKATSLNLDYSVLFPEATPYNDTINQLKAEIAAIKKQYKPASGLHQFFYTGEKDLKNELKIISLQNEIATNRRLRRLLHSDRFDQILDQQIILGNTNPLHMIYEIVVLETAGYIPRHFNSEHHFEYENEGELRVHELAWRVRNVRAMISEMFRNRRGEPEFLRFVENDKTWSYPVTRHPIQNLPLNQPDILPLDGEIEYKNPTGAKSNIDYVTFNYKQIDLWVEMALRYMFPVVSSKLFPPDKCSIVSSIPRIDIKTGQPMIDPETGEVVMLKRALTVHGRSEVNSTFLSIVANPMFENCGYADWMDAAVSQKLTWFASSESQKKERARFFFYDFGHTHVTPDARLVDFQTDMGIEKLYHDYKVLPFKSWGQLNVNEQIAINLKMAQRLKKDDTPYDVDGDSKAQFSH